MVRRKGVNGKPHIIPEYGSRPPFQETSTSTNASIPGPAINTPLYQNGSLGNPLPQRSLQTHTAIPFPNSPAQPNQNPVQGPLNHRIDEGIVPPLQVTSGNLHLSNAVGDSSLVPDTKIPPLALSVPQRPPMSKRSSSLEVHAPSPQPLENQPSGIQSASTDLYPGLPSGGPTGNAWMPDTGAVTFSFGEEWAFLPSQNHPTGVSGSRIEAGANQYSVLSPESSYDELANAPHSRPNSSSLHSEGFSIISRHDAYAQDTVSSTNTLVHTPAMSYSSPFMPASDFSGLYNSPQYSSLDAANRPIPYPVPTTDGFSEGKLHLPQHQPPKYPPCWLTEEGLLIVPSVPGKPVDDDETPKKNKNNPAYSQVASSPRKRYATNLQSNLTPGEDNEEFNIVALSPNVTRYRKGKCPKRRRCPSYYDSDIIP